MRSRIVKERGVPRAQEVPGEPNAESRVERTEVHGEWARYRLLPRTGKTHQLRLHMWSLGLPIFGDTFYPELRDADPGDFSEPLRLLAGRSRFTDPFTGAERHFERAASELAGAR